MKHFTGVKFKSKFAFKFKFELSDSSGFEWAFISETLALNRPITNENANCNK